MPDDMSDPSVIPVSTDELATEDGELTDDEATLDGETAVLPAALLLPHAASISTSMMGARYRMTSPFGTTGQHLMESKPRLYSGWVSSWSRLGHPYQLSRSRQRGPAGLGAPRRV